MKLISLKLTAFKGVASFTLDAKGNDLIVEAQNGAGKTTLMDAYLWLLTGKDSLGQAQFDIKTLAANGAVAKHGIDHEVEARIRGEENPPGTALLYDLKKVYREKWTTKRGSADKEFTGHEVEHWIDGVPKSKAEFDSFVGSLLEVVS